LSTCAAPESLASFAASLQHTPYTMALQRSSLSAESRTTARPACMWKMQQLITSSSAHRAGICDSIRGTCKANHILGHEKVRPSGRECCSLSCGGAARERTSCAACPRIHVARDVNAACTKWTARIAASLTVAGIHRRGHAGLSLSSSAGTLVGTCANARHELADAERSEFGLTRTACASLPSSLGRQARAAPQTAR